MMLMLSGLTATTLAALPPQAERAPTPEPLAEPARPGTWWLAPPSTPAVPSVAPPTTQAIRGWLTADRNERALRAATDYAETKRWGRSRDAAWLVAGLLQRASGRHNLASEAFTHVRAAGGPLAPWGAWHEAEQDLARGKPHVAIKECEGYLTQWPRGPHAQACQRLIPKAYASIGAITKARAAAEAYDAEHDDGIGEYVELALAEALRESEPTLAAQLYRKLAIEHTVPAIGKAAEARLLALDQAGIEGAKLPDDVPSLKLRAVSLRRASRRTEAWLAYQQLAELAADDPKLAAWVDSEAKPFGWYTWQWTFLDEWYRARYERHGEADDAWGRYKVLCRDGRWAEAAAFGKEALARHGGQAKWRRATEDLARITMLSGNYVGARELFDRVAKRGGWSGRRARFYAAFASYMAHDLPDAVERFDGIVSSNRSYVTEARYWRAKAHDLAGDDDQAAASALADRQWIHENDPGSWYGLLLRETAEDRPLMAPFARSGRWPGPELPEVVAAAPRNELPVSMPVARSAANKVMAAAQGFTVLRWPMRVDPPPPPPTEPALHRNLVAPPPSPSTSPLYDAERARQRLAALAQEHLEAWPELQVALDLADVGLYDLAGPVMSQVYETRRKALRSRSHPRYTAATRLSQPQGHWRDMFLYTHDHYHTSRFVHGLWDKVDDEQRAEAMRLGYPLAHAGPVWRAARKHDVDPYFVLGLMRQESNYHSIALSSAGARGAMQIMPRTGNLLADIRGDVEFNAGDLEDAILSVEYGIGYLGLLLDRFDGVFPLAAASYNGGPHNVSVWLQGTGPDTQTDVFVEHIPFKETRRYVKRVAENYETYVSIYAPTGTEVAVPPRPLGDDPGVVNF